MSFEAAGLNSRRPVLISALGRAWLAFCPEEERRTILRDIGGLTPRQETALGAALERSGATAMPSPGRRGRRACTASPWRSARAAARERA